MECLGDEPSADAFFKTLAGSHQRYFSKWIDDAKTVETKTKTDRIGGNGLVQKTGVSGNAQKS